MQLRGHVQIRQGASVATAALLKTPPQAADKATRKAVKPKGKNRTGR